jgi:hypothetical protein
MTMNSSALKALIMSKKRFLPSVEMTFRHVSGGEGGAATSTSLSDQSRPSLPLPSAFSRHFERQREISYSAMHTFCSSLYAGYLKTLSLSLFLGFSWNCVVGFIWLIFGWNYDCVLTEKVWGIFGVVLMSWTMWKDYGVFLRRAFRGKCLDCFSGNRIKMANLQNLCTSITPCQLFQ